MRNGRPRAIAACFAMAGVAAGTEVRAACPSLARGSLSEPGARLSGQWLYDAQLRDAHRARTWRYVWSGVNGGLAVTSFALMPFVTRDQRVELAVGGAYSTVAAAFTWFVPLEVESALDRRGNAVPLCQGLHLEEQFASEAAADEAARVTWPWHALNFVAGGAYTAIVGFGTGQWVNGVVDGVLTVVVGEAQLFTQPTHLADNYDAYRRAGASRRAFFVRPESHGFSIAFGGTF